MQLVPAPHGNAIEPSDSRLTAPQERFDRPLEEAHVLPVVPGALGVPFGIFADVPAGAERHGSRAREYDHADRIIDRGVFDGSGKLLQRPGGIGVVHLGTIEGNSRDALALLVEEVLEGELLRSHRCEGVTFPLGNGLLGRALGHSNVLELLRRSEDDAHSPLPVRGPPVERCRTLALRRSRR